MEVYLEKEAFILGEKIKLKIDISNMSNQNVDEVNIEVEKVILYKSNIIYHEITANISETKKNVSVC